MEFYYPKKNSSLSTLKTIMYTYKDVMYSEFYFISNSYKRISFYYGMKNNLSNANKLIPTKGIVIMDNKYYKIIRVNDFTQNP